MMSTYVLDELKKAGYMPSVIITTPDKPRGRKLIVTPNEVKQWGLDNNVHVHDPLKLGEEFASMLRSDVEEKSIEVFIVASYGKIIPDSIFTIPKRMTLNVHPSFLPKYRGASPLQSAILDDAKKTGVTIMRINEKMDEGPIVAQKEVTISEWPTYEVFEESMAREGGKLLAEILPDWVAGNITEHEQDHTQVTYTKKFTKEDGLIEITGKNSQDTKTMRAHFLKIQALHQSPGAYFMHTFTDKAGVEKNIRVKVTQASWKNDTLIIEKVIPESAKEMDYESFVRGYGVR